MAKLPSTGPISLSQIYTTLEKTLGPSISLATASTGGYGAIKTTSTFRPDGIAPHAMSEFRSYDHSMVDKIVPSTPINLRCTTGYGDPMSTVYIEWTASTDNLAVAGYELQRRLDTNGRWFAEYTNTDTFYNDLTAYKGLYFYRVRAFDEARNYSEFSTIQHWNTEINV